MRARSIGIEQEVAALGDLSREELAAWWQKAYGCPAPKGIRRGLLVRAAAWPVAVCSPRSSPMEQAAQSERKSQRFCYLALPLARGRFASASIWPGLRNSWAGGCGKHRHARLGGRS